MQKILLLVLAPFILAAQEKLSDLSSFKPSAANWSVVSNVSADINKENTLITSPGTGIIVCNHEKGKYGMEYELFSKNEYGDMDIEFDFMMAKGANSGIYLQGRYEIQLFDSWGKSNKYYDCGGIYERWNDSKPEGEKGYEGYAPRTNATKAPGLWQNMKISFQAPRFDAAGNKVSNAKFLHIILNDQIIHENVEVTGPTRGGDAKEVAKGPLRIQGDHGSVAFKNMTINNFDKTAGKLSDLNYKVYYGSYQHDADLSTLKIDERGKTDDLTWEVTKKDNDYVFVIKGKYFAPTSGNYTFKSQIGGNSTLKIDGKEILDNKWTVASQSREASIDLTAGMHDLEIFNNKRDGWLKPALGFWSAGPGFRSTPHHSVGSLIASKPTDPILISPSTTPVLRSFMDFKKGNVDTRVVHAISVGSSDNIHYTYDYDKGAILQVWRGKFLDATPMWNDRGDGSSKPLGSFTLLSNDVFWSKNNEATWPKDTSGSGFKPLSYTLDEQDRPTFNYKIYNRKVTDKITIVEAKILNREISQEDPSLYAKLADGKNIEEIEPNLFAVDNKSYYIKIEQANNVAVSGGNRLTAQAKNGKIIYSILF